MAFKIKKDNKVIAQTNKKFQALQEEVKNQEIEKIPLSKLMINPDNEKVYGKQNKKRIKELGEDIKINGQLEPLIVTPKDNSFLIIAGTTRYYSCLEINHDPVDVIIRDVTEFEAKKAFISTNNYRIKDTVIRANEIEYLRELYSEEKEKFPMYLEGINVTEKIAQDLEVDISTVQRADRLNKVVPEIKKAITNEKISATAAQRLSDMDTDTQKEIAEILEKEKSKININDTIKILKTNKEFESKIKELETKLKNQKQADIVIKNLNNEIEILKEQKAEKIKEIIKKDPTNINYIVSSLEHSKNKIFQDLSFLSKEKINNEDKKTANTLLLSIIEELKEKLYDI